MAHSHGRVAANEPFRAQIRHKLKTPTRLLR